MAAPAISTDASFAIGNLQTNRLSSTDPRTSLTLDAGSTGVSVIDQTTSSGSLQITPTAIRSVGDTADETGETAVLGIQASEVRLFNQDGNPTDFIVGTLKISTVNDSDDSLKSILHSDPAFPKSYLNSTADDIVLSGQNVTSTHVITVGELRMYSGTTDGQGVLSQAFGKSAAGVPKSLKTRFDLAGAAEGGVFSLESDAEEFRVHSAGAVRLSSAGQELVFDAAVSYRDASLGVEGVAPGLSRSAGDFVLGSGGRLILQGTHVDVLSENLTVLPGLQLTTNVLKTPADDPVLELRADQLQVPTTLVSEESRDVVFVPKLVPLGGIAGFSSTGESRVEFATKAELLTLQGRTAVELSAVHEEVSRASRALEPRLLGLATEHHSEAAKIRTELGRYLLIGEASTTYRTQGQVEAIVGSVLGSYLLAEDAEVTYATFQQVSESISNAVSPYLTRSEIFSLVDDAVIRAISGSNASLSSYLTADGTREAIMASTAPFLAGETHSRARFDALEKRMGSLRSTVRVLSSRVDSRGESEIRTVAGSMGDGTDSGDAPLTDDTNDANLIAGAHTQSTLLAELERVKKSNLGLELKLKRLDVKLGTIAQVSAGVSPVASAVDSGGKDQEGGSDRIASSPVCDLVEVRIKSLENGQKRAELNFARELGKINVRLSLAELAADANGKARDGSNGQGEVGGDGVNDGMDDASHKLSGVVESTVVNELGLELLRSRMRTLQTALSKTDADVRVVMTELVKVQSNVFQSEPSAPVDEHTHDDSVGHAPTSHHAERLQLLSEIHAIAKEVTTKQLDLKKEIHSIRTSILAMEGQVRKEMVTKRDFDARVDAKVTEAVSQQLDGTDIGSEFFYTKSQINAGLQNYTTKDYVSDNYYNKFQVDDKIDSVETAGVDLTHYYNKNQTETLIDEAVADASSNGTSLLTPSGQSIAYVPDFQLPNDVSALSKGFWEITGGSGLQLTRTFHDMADHSTPCQIVSYRFVIQDDGSLAVVKFSDCEMVGPVLIIDK